jgi:hypothetical protein
MGYDLHITRKSDWPLRGNDITFDEWLAVVAADPEMRLDGFAEAPLPDGEVLRTEDASLAVWTAYPGHGVDGGMALMWLSGGNIDTKNPDEHIRRKLWRLAQALNARVQGDDGEFYDEFGNGAYEELPPMRPEESAYELPPLRPDEAQAESTNGWLTRLLSSLRRHP